MDGKTVESTVLAIQYQRLMITLAVFDLKIAFWWELGVLSLQCHVLTIFRAF